jgi:phosphatidylinositol alpha-1,6-mannosyltransferase
MEVEVVAGDGPGSENFDRTSSLPIVRAPLAFANWGVMTRRGPVEYVRAFRTVRQVIARRPPRAIHCGKALPEGLIALACARRWHIPFVCYVHGEELSLARTSRELKWLTQLVLTQATTIVANSRNTEDMLKRDWSVSRSIAVMHPGVDASRFVPAPADPMARERLGWGGRRVVLTVGALQKRKGQDMMIRALPAIRAACADVLYVVAGEGWERPYLESLVDGLLLRDAVQFLDAPPDDQLIECYQQCDLFALPNRQVGWDIEGFGIVLLEAQACGKAVLAGQSGGTVETIRKGVTGELVPCDNPEPLARAVIDLLEHPDRRRAMGAAGREWVVDHFDWVPLKKQAEALFAGPSASLETDTMTIAP